MGTEQPMASRGSPCPVPGQSITLISRDNHFTRYSLFFILWFIVIATCLPVGLEEKLPAETFEHELMSISATPQQHGYKLLSAQTLSCNLSVTQKTQMNMGNIGNPSNQSRYNTTHADAKCNTKRVGLTRMQCTPFRHSSRSSLQTPSDRWGRCQPSPWSSSGWQPRPCCASCRSSPSP